MPHAIVLRAVSIGLHRWTLKNFAVRIVKISDYVCALVHITRLVAGYCLRLPRRKACPFANDSAVFKLPGILQQLRNSVVRLWIGFLGCFGLWGCCKKW
jgi:hypothetical protein